MKKLFFVLAMLCATYTTQVKPIDFAKTSKKIFNYTKNLNGNQIAQVVTGGWLTTKSVKHALQSINHCAKWKCSPRKLIGSLGKSTICAPIAYFLLKDNYYKIKSCVC